MTPNDDHRRQAHTDDFLVAALHREKPTAELCERAADRIEELGATVARLDAEVALLRLERDGLGAQLLDVQQDCIKATQEVARLRAALREIETAPDMGDYHHHRWVCFKASAALNAARTQAADEEDPDA